MEIKKNYSKFEKWYPYSGLIYLKKQGEEKMRIPKLLKQTVIFLYKYIEESNEYHALGTGFFIGLIEEDSFFPYLVTCKHVIKDSIDDGHTIHGRFNIAEEMDVGFEPFPNEWVYHDDPAIDLAILSWPKTGENPPYRWGALPFNDAIYRPIDVPIMDGGVVEGDEVFFVGLFTQFTGIKRNYPIVRFGKVALLTDELIHTELGLSKNILIECQAYPGNSGSPLFIPTKTKNGEIVASLLGVIAGYWPDTQEIYVEDEKSLKVFSHFGISMAVPAPKISDILYGKEFMKQREEKKNSARMKRMPMPAKNELKGINAEMSKEEFLNVLKMASSPNDESPDDDK